MTDGSFNKFLTPLGTGILGIVIAIGPVYITLKKDMEKKIRAEVETAVRLNQLETIQKTHKDKIWVIEGDISNLKSRHINDE